VNPVFKGLARSGKKMSPTAVNGLRTPLCTPESELNTRELRLNAQDF
jgi:hypothetical protein